MSEVILFSLFPDSIHFYVLFCGFVRNKDIDPDRDPAHALSLITNGHGDPILEAKFTPARSAGYVTNGKTTKSLYNTSERSPKSCWIRKM